MRLIDYVLILDSITAGLRGPAICSMLEISRATFNRGLEELRSVGCAFTYDRITKIYTITDFGPFCRADDLLTGLSVQPNHRSPGFPNPWQGLPKLPGANASAGRTAQAGRRGEGSEDGEAQGA